MAEKRNFLSESWLYIANQKIHLRPTLNIQKQFYRGEQWYVLSDPFTNRYYRFRPESYNFLARLTSIRTVDEVWNECMKLDPENSPGQDDVIQILSQLYRMNLIQSELSQDSIKLFNRHKEHKHRMIRSQLTSILFIRVPLFDPQILLDRTWALVKLFFSKFSFIIWLIVVGLALKTVFGNWHLALDQQQTILAPSNVPLLLISFFIIKIFHEFGHAYAVKKYHGEVHTMGIMFLVFSPIPYVDATAAWSFRERWKRVFVGAAGMIVEIFIAALATIIWANSGDGLINSLAYNVMFIASVTTVLFNANPLLRFDGYYILSDLTDTPNLHQRSQRMIYFLVERYFFGVKNSIFPAKHKKEAVWLFVFGVLSWLYRIYIFTVIIWFVADRFFGLGLIAAIIGLIGLLIMPLVKFTKYLSTDHRLARTRFRAVVVTFAFISLIIVSLAWVPFPNYFRSPGVFRSSQYTKVFADVDGYVAQVHKQSKTNVKKGDVLITLKNKDLDNRLIAALAKRDQLLAQESAALINPSSQLVPIRKFLNTNDKMLAHLEEQKAALEIRATVDGLWVSPDTDHYHGMWLKRGVMVGEIVTPNQFEFNAIIDQDNASEFFENRVSEVEIRIPGEAEHRILVSDFNIIPSQQEYLPTSALGWSGGGPVKVALDDPSGMLADEEFFLVTCQVIKNDSASYFHNRLAQSRFKLPDEPLLWQGLRKLKRLLQSRFQY